MKSFSVFVIAIVGAATGAAAAATTTFPKASGETAAPKPITVSGSFDGKMMRYNRNRK